MVRMLLKQLKAHPFTIILFIIGFMISNLIISIGISTETNMKNLQLEKREGYDKKSLKGEIVYTDLNVSYDDIRENFKGIDYGTRVTLNEVYSEIKKGNEKEEVEIINDIFKKEREMYPLLSGTFYTIKDIESRAKVVVIGKELKKYIYEKNKIQYIKLADEEFKVIGVVGREDKNSAWDKNIFMPLESVPKDCKNQYVRYITQNFVISNENMEVIDEVEKIKNRIRERDKNVEINLEEMENGNDIYGSISENALVRIGVWILIVAIINVINISSFWIDDRKEEFAIRKAFGIDEIKIIGMLFMEMLSIIAFSVVLGLIVQSILSSIIQGSTIISLNIYWENIIMGILLSIMTALVTLVVPIYKILRLEPVKVLRGE